MTQPAIELDLLEQFIVAPDLRQTAEAALLAFRGIVSGEHFSAMLFNAKLHLVEFTDPGAGYCTARRPPEVPHHASRITFYVSLI